MALAMTEMCLTIPLASFVIYLNRTQPLVPWRGWADTHYNFSRVVLIPAVYWQDDSLLVAAFELNRWISPFCAFVFFAYFGFAQEARRNYMRFLRCVGQKFGLKQS